MKRHQGNLEAKAHQQQRDSCQQHRIVARHTDFIGQHDTDTADIGLPSRAVHQGDAIQQKCRGKPAKDEILEPRFLTGCSPSIARREHIQRQTQYLDTQK